MSGTDRQRVTPIFKMYDDEADVDGDASADEEMEPGRASDNEFINDEATDSNTGSDTDSDGGVRSATRLFVRQTYGDEASSSDEQTV